VLGKWGKYELVEKLGQGGMAEVYRGRGLGEDDFSRRLCIKVIHAALSNDPYFVEMFGQEARTAASLEHPNIVSVYDFVRYEDRRFLVMELVDGVDLRSLLREVRGLGFSLPLGFVQHVASGLLAALAYAHGRSVDGEPAPVIHRDVSPHNILISTKGEVKLADFGIAKAHGESAATKTGLIKGKIEFLSPEQARAEEVGPATDQYSAGLVIYELLTGKRLIRAAGEAQTLARATNPPTPDLSWLSGDWRRFVTRLLARSPGDRYASAEEAAEALERISTGESYSAKKAGQLVFRVRQLIADPLAPQPTELVTPTPDPIADSSEVAAEVRADPLEDDLTRSSTSDVKVPPAPEKASSDKPDKGRYAWLKAALAFAAALALFLAANHMMKEATGDDEAAGPGALSETEMGDGGVLASATEETSSPTASAGAVDGGVDGGAEAGQGTGSDRAVAGGPGFGRLEVNCRPWAEVSVDGRNVGTTPIKNLKVRAGKRRVTLANDELGYERTFTVEVPRGGSGSLSKEIPGTGSAGSPPSTAP